MRLRGVKAAALLGALALPLGVHAQGVSDAPPTSSAPTGVQAPDIGGSGDVGTVNAPPLVVETPDAPGGAGLPIMTLDQEALYAQSLWGQRAQASLERRGREIAQENDRLADKFAAEEQELTALRQSLPADEFRKRAEEFDQRVVAVRRDRDVAARALQTEADEERQAFFRAALPVLATLMRERGALAILDQRAIFVAAQSIDVTEALIERVDAEIGAGPIDEDAAATPSPETDDSGQATDGQTTDGQTTDGQTTDGTAASQPSETLPTTPPDTRPAIEPGTQPDPAAAD